MGWRIENEVIKSDYDADDGSGGLELEMQGSSVSSFISIEQEGNCIFFDMDLLRKFVDRVKVCL